MDKVSKEKRHEIMSCVKSKNTAPEIVVRSLLFAEGYRFRIHCKEMPGKPDIVLKKHKLVIFVNGCFWHGHNCQHGMRKPKTNSKYWKSKIDGNVVRDKKHIRMLKNDGWQVLIIWECELKRFSKLESKLLKILSQNH